MGMIKKSITITEQQDAWIQAQMSAGGYATDSEVIREAIREKQDRAADAERIRGALIEAEQSGVSRRSRDEIRQAVIAQLKRDGLLPT